MKSNEEMQPSVPSPLPEYSLHMQVTEMRKDIQYIVKMFEDLKSSIANNKKENDKNFATKEEVAKLRTEFLPVKLIAFGMAGFILLAFLGNLINK